MIPRKLLAAGSILVGLLTLATQFASYEASRQIVDYISTGLWGGIAMIVGSTIIILELPYLGCTICSMGLSILSGFILVALYSWNLNRFFRIYTSADICELYAPGLLNDPDSCESVVTIHCVMITLGLAAMILNMSLLVLTCRKRTGPEKPFYKQHTPINRKNESGVSSTLI